MCTAYDNALPQALRRPSPRVARVSAGNAEAFSRLLEDTNELQCVEEVHRVGHLEKGKGNKSKREEKQERFQLTGKVTRFFHRLCPSH